MKKIVKAELFYAVVAIFLFWCDIRWALSKENISTIAATIVVGLFVILFLNLFSWICCRLVQSFNDIDPFLFNISAVIAGIVAIFTALITMIVSVTICRPIGIFITVIILIIIIGVLQRTINSAVGELKLKKRIILVSILGEMILIWTGFWLVTILSPHIPSLTRLMMRPI